MTVTVDEAQALLDLARAEEKQTARNQLVTRLAEVRAQLVAARAGYKAMAARVQAEREFRSAMQLRIKAALEAIDLHAQSKPRIADYVLGDPEAVEWRRHAQELGRYREALTAELVAAGEIPIMEYIHFEGPHGTLATLEYAEASLLNALNTEPGDVNGGVFRVG